MPSILVTSPIAFLPKYQRIVRAFYKKFENEIVTLSQQLSLAEQALENIVDALLIATDDWEEQQRASGQQEHDDGEPTADEVPSFSRFDNAMQYNGRSLSKYRIDSLVSTVFAHRKVFQEDKMKGLCACILKIDFNYKLAGKIRVWTKQGKSFCPFKCIVTVQNEDGLTVFWKALRHSESFSEIKPDLLRLRKRLNANYAVIQKQRHAVAAELTDEVIEIAIDEQAVKVCYVDNCCGVCNMLQMSFPDSETKLDAFHWMKRWNQILQDVQSAEAGVFRALMHRALFNVEPGEYERARLALIAKKKKEPTVKEILKEANAVIPPPAALRANVEAVLTYVTAKDTETERKMSMRMEGDTSPMPNRFLKNSHANREVIRNQFVHVDKGCLSDPSPDKVNIFRKNPKTGEVFVARGTNTNERDNLDLAHKILTATHIGKSRSYAPT